MEIILRKVALTAGLKTYYTGKPCKHGHFSPRYTESGACAECINGARVATRAALRGQDDIGGRASAVAEVQRAQSDEKARHTAEFTARELALGQLIPHGIPLRKASDWEEVREVILYLTISRFPVLTVLDIVGSAKPEGGGTLRRVNLHPDDYLSILQFIENKISLIRTDLEEWINCPVPIQAWFSRGADGGIEYPNVEFKGNWYNHAELLACCRGEREKIQAVQHVPPQGFDMDGLARHIWAMVGSGVLMEDLQRQCPEWYAQNQRPPVDP